MYTIKDLRSDVRQEADNIKKYATKEEISRLDFKSLDPKKIDRCIYGQMTGNCDNERAVELITLCAKRYVKDNQLTMIRVDGFERIASRVNGETVDQLSLRRASSSYPLTQHSSMIEAYILLPGAKNESLINYIKGETKALKL